MPISRRECRGKDGAGPRNPDRGVTGVKGPTPWRAPACFHRRGAAREWDGPGGGVVRFSLPTLGRRSGPAGGRTMARWLFKEEPEVYSFADLQRDGSTLWEGVSNAQARQYLRQVRAGDRVLYY